MPRSKKPGRRGMQGGPARGGGLRRMEHSVAPLKGQSSLSANGANDHVFSLQDEARHSTERQQSFWDSRLRDSKVTFVSAGALEPTEPIATEAAFAGMSLSSSDKVDVSDQEHVEVDDGACDADLELPSGHMSQCSNELTTNQNPGFVVDVTGGALIRTGISSPQLRSVSPARSDSSEEIILFGGRDDKGRGISRNPGQSRTITDPIEQRIRKVEDEIHKREELLEAVIRHNTVSPIATRDLSAEASTFDSEPAWPKPPKHAGRRSRRKDKGSNDLDDEMIADYMANMASDEELLGSFAHRQLGGAEDEIWQDTETSSRDAAQKSKSFRADWNHSDLKDLDDLSTSDGVMGEIRAILSKRIRPSGVQYLIVWEDQSVDEARWVPSTTLNSVTALSQVEIFEAEEELVAEIRGDSEDSSTDSEELIVDVDIEESDSESLDRIITMSDAKLARLLAKQEQLGMGSSKLILFDDIEDDDHDAEQRFSTTVGLARSSTTTGTSGGRASKRPRGVFPPATALADAYDGFDVMDFDRPSLKKPPKNRRGKLVHDVSDSELEAVMNMAWENDRLKKKERKQEREDLRAQGLLGKKNGKPELKQKYKEGMGIHAVKDEIKQFLMGNNTTLRLPPMDKADRKVVHELANAFNLKSKSAGAGNKRFPILIRTSRTSIFAEHTFNAVEARLSRHFLPRMDVSGKGGGSKRGARGGGFGGGFNAGVIYRDGDIVGGSAPELGVENRGRAMLEKMGWSSGTALGALNNKGILQPVSHVVKTTKAGLG